MRLLVITYSFAPAINPRALRWTEIVQYWVRHGHVVDVVSAWVPGATRHESSPNLNVYRAGGALLERLRRLLSRGAVVGAGGSAAVSAVSRAGWFRRMVKWAHDHSWKLIYWPDYAALWYFAARRLLHQHLSGRRYDAIISVSLPFTGHLVGRYAKRSGFAQRWIVDAGDPFCFMDETPPNNRLLYTGLNFVTERRVFAEADAVSVTTVGTRDRYAQLFPASAAKIVVIPPLLSRQPGEDGGMFPDDGRIRLAFIGTLYRAIRSPMFLLSLFERLLRQTGPLELHFFGELHDCEEVFAPYHALLGKQIFVHGRVSPAIARRAMAGADVLINIGNLTSYQLPSKIVEYVSTGKRVLNIASNADDASTQFLADYPYALTVLPACGQLDDASYTRVVEFLTMFYRGTSALAHNWTRRFEVETIAPQYERLIVPPGK